MTMLEVRLEIAILRYIQWTENVVCFLRLLDGFMETNTMNPDQSDCFPGAYGNLMEVVTGGVRVKD